MFQRFFYGRDGVVEDGLSEIEGKLAESSKKIIVKRKVPKKLSKEHINLLVFVGLTHLRNPVVIQNMKDLFRSSQSMLNQLDPIFDASLHFPDIEHEDLIKMSLSAVSEVVKYIGDLDFKLLINKTTMPFITSDFPVIKYNQFLEERKWIHGKTGYGCTGLQIIIPLNDELSIIFYDSLIYKIGDKRKDYLEITNRMDIKQLNILQLLNCLETVYFNENISDHEIREMSQDASKFTRPNVVQSSLHYLSDGKTSFQPGKENLIVSGSTELEIKLNLEGIYIHSIGKNRELSDSVAQLRPAPMRLAKERERK